MAVALRRITCGYSILVPAAGIVLAFVQGRTSEIWISHAMILTAAAGFLSAPSVRCASRAGEHGDRLRTIAVLAGFYNLLWAVLVVLLIVRTGSTKGV